MKGIFMTKREHFKFLRNNGNTLKRIAELMNVSEKTTKRWNKELKEGTLIREHGLTTKKSNFSSKIDRKRIVDEYLKLSTFLSKDKKAEGYNFSYYHHYKFQGGCSFGTFKLIMKEEYIASPNAHSKTKKFYNQVLKSKIKKEDISKDEIKKINEKIALNSKIYFRKPRIENEGEEGQIDACHDYWLGPWQSHLHACYDPAVRKITSAHLEKEETTHGYYMLLEQLITNNKVPERFKGDCRSSFVINKKNAGALAHKDVNTQFGYVLNILGVKMENSSEPTFKGGIERFFRTAQNQLKGEFRERGIKTFKEANEYLKIYIKQYNDQYSLEPIKPESKFKKISLSEEKINQLLSIRSFRKTDKANSISYKNKLYSLYENKNRVSFSEKSPILILETLNGKRIAKYMGNELEMKLTDLEYLTSSQKEQYHNLKRLTPSFSVADYHPWGYKVFLMYLHKSKNLKRYLKH